MSTRDEAREIIKLARSILRPAGAWAKHQFLAADREGRDVPALHARAVAWTALGALRVASNRLGLDTQSGWPIALWAAQDMVEEAVHRQMDVHQNLVSFNRQAFTTQEKVIAVLDVALDPAKQIAA